MLKKIKLNVIICMFYIAKWQKMKKNPTFFTFFYNLIWYFKIK